MWLPFSRNHALSHVKMSKTTLLPFLFMCALSTHAVGQTLADFDRGDEPLKSA
jgi:hypothetical protein